MPTWDRHKGKTDSFLDVCRASVYVFISGLHRCKCEDYQGSASAACCVCLQCLFLYVCTCLWVLGRSEVLVGLIETDHCQRSRSSGRLSWNTNTDRNRGCLTHTRTEMCRLILFLFLSSPSSFSSSTLSPVFINPLLWCLASCPLALSAVDWPWWCHGHHENVSLM